MSDRLAVSLGVEDFNLYKQQMTEAKALAIDVNKTINALGTVNFNKVIVSATDQVSAGFQKAQTSAKTFERENKKAFDSITKDIQKSLDVQLKEYEKSERERVQMEKETARQITQINKETARSVASFEKGLEQMTKDRVKEQNRAIKKGADDFLDLLNKVNAEEKRINNSRPAGVSNRGGNVIGEIASGLGFGTAGNLLSGTLGVAAGVGAAVYGINKFIDVSEQAIQKSIESARANRLLSASATELGVTYADLSEKNRKFAFDAGLSNVAASSTTARIAQLARGSGKPQDFDRISQSFLDLGAARGIDTNDLETLIGTILSGQDEGLNKLGIADPSKLYESYGRQLGKTADQLTQFEKVQAAVNAVVEKGAIFTGANQAKMNSLEGTVLRNAAAWENLKTSLSDNFAKSYEVTSFLEELSKGVKSLTANLDDLQTKASKGIKITDKDISDAAQPGALSSIGSTIGKGFLQFMSGVATLPRIATLGLYNPLQSSADKFATASVNLSPEYQQQYREDFLRQQINAQKLQEAIQKKAAEDQKKALDDQVKKQQEITDQIKLQADLKVTRENPFTTISQLENQYRGLTNDFFNKVNLDQTKKAEEAAKTLEEIYKRTSQDFRLRLQNPANSLADIRKTLADVQNSEKLIPNEKQSLIFDAEGKIKSNIEQGLTKVDQLQKQFVSTVDSLFVKASSANPFSKIFADANKSIDTLRENLRGLSPELIGLFEEMERKQQSLALFETRLNNALDVLGLREQAANLRNPSTTKALTKDDIENTQAAFANKTIFNPFYDMTGGDDSRGLFRNQSYNPFSITGKIVEDLAYSGGGNLSKTQIQDIYERGLLNNISGTRPSDLPPAILDRGYKLDPSRSFVFNSSLDVAARGLDKNPLTQNPNQVLFPSDSNLSLNQQSLITSLANDRLRMQGLLGDNPNQTAQDRLQKQFDVITGFKAQNDEELGIADRKILALIQGVDPNNLNDYQRNLAAGAAERQADRKSNEESEARQREQKRDELLQKTYEETKKLREIAEKQGKEGVETTLRVVDETSGRKVASVTNTRPNPKNTADHYKK